MANRKYTSKYPAIVTDKNANSVNDSMIKKITVEEYYDLKHHTHSMSDLAADEGSMTYNELQELVNNLNNITQKMEADTSELKAIIQNQNEVINVMKQEMEAMASIMDWDVTKPGNQDHEGNDLGTLMGFNMTEIQ